MTEVERISVKKIYVGNAALFGLLYGMVIGVIFALIFIVLGIVGFSTILAGMQGTENLSTLSTGTIVFIGLMFIPGLAVSSGVSAVIFAALYNFVAVMKGDVHLGLVETKKDVAEAPSAEIVS